jgi:hypothetical protein
MKGQPIRNTSLRQRLRQRRLLDDIVHAADVADEIVRRGR